jgi:16S rRNA processing protein RimM
MEHMNDDRLTIGYVAGAHGIRGALKVRLHDPGSDALQPGVVVALARAGSEPVERTVEHVSSGKKSEVLVELAGVRDRDAAEALRGCEVQIDRAHLPPLEDDEYYLADLVGARVERATASGEREALGEVVGVTTNGAQDLLEIEWTDPTGARHGWLLPALPGFVLDVQQGGSGAPSEATVLADVPPGFLPDALEREDA